MGKILKHDRANIFWALDAWFDSQNIELSDRAYLCAEAAGIYIGQLPGDKSHLQDGLKILGKTMIRAGVGIYRVLNEEDKK